jgi:hypothetical protein
MTHPTIDTIIPIIASIQNSLLSESTENTKKIALTGSMAILLHMFTIQKFDEYLKNVGFPNDFDFLLKDDIKTFNVPYIENCKRESKYQLRSGKYINPNGQSFDLTLNSVVPTEIINICNYNIYIHKFSDLLETYKEFELNNEYYLKKINYMETVKHLCKNNNLSDTQPDFHTNNKTISKKLLFDTELDTNKTILKKLFDD